MLVGIDLAGPKNHKETAVATIVNKKITLDSGYSDSDIYKLIKNTNVDLIGIDAPLSYNEQGGYRDSDRELRKLLNSRGFKDIGVMAPTYNRMIYLTSRGIRLSRLINSITPSPPLFEVHPGAFFVLDNFPYKTVIDLKKSKDAILKLYNLIGNRGYTFNREPISDHEIMAVGVALALKAKLNGTIHWEHPGEYLDDYPLIV